MRTVIVGILTFINMINTASEIVKARKFLFAGILVFFVQHDFFITSGPDPLNCLRAVVRERSFPRIGLELAIDPPPPPGGILYTMIFWNYII